MTNLTNVRAILDMILEGGSSYIKRLVDEQRPEDLWLDFKEKSHPENLGEMSRDDKRNFARALSGFANASGGLLIWGVGARTIEKFRVAYELKPIRNLTSFVNTLNGLIPEAVTPLVDGVRNEVIRDSSGEGGYVATYVPEGTRTPHRAELGLGRYFKRSGDSFRQMEHFDLEDMFGRRQRPDLSLNIVREKQQITDALHKYGLSITIQNNGRAISRYYGFDIDFPNISTTGDHEGLTVSPHSSRPDFIRLTYRSTPSDPPIFPGESVNIVPNPDRGGSFYYYVDNVVFSRHYGNVEYRVYSDNAQIKEGQVPFSDLNVY